MRIESGFIKQGHVKVILDALTKGMTNSTYLSSISGLGPIREFEMAFAKAAGAQYALALSSCTAAIHTALMTLGIRNGDEVIVTPYTWGQSVAPVIFCGATAVFADIDPETCTIDPESIKSRITNETKAILPVHIFGIPADMDQICSIANNNNLYVISDAAQAFGALSKGRKIGSLGDVTCFSLGIGKGVFGGEGGVLVTNNGILYEKAVAISQHPLRAHREVLYDKIPFMDELGWNYRIHPLSSLLALEGLKYAEARIFQRKEMQNRIQKKLQSNSYVKIIKSHPEDSSSAYSMPLTFNYMGDSGLSRESLIETLQSKSISVQAGPIKVPIHLRSTFHNVTNLSNRISTHITHRKGSCPVAEYRCEHQELQI